MSLLRFFGQLRKATRARNVDDAATNLIELRRVSTETGVFTAAIRSAVDDVTRMRPTVSTGGDVFVNGKSLSTFETALRRGDVVDALKNVGRDVSDIPATGQLQYKRYVASVLPDSEMERLSKVANPYKSTQTDLNVVPPKSTTDADLLQFQNSLSPSTQSKLDDIYTRLTKVEPKRGGIVKTASQITKVTGGLVVLGVTGYVLYDLIQATNARNGCWLSRMVNGKLERLKLPSRSCSDASLDDEPASEDLRATAAALPLNVAVEVDHAVKNKKIAVLEKIGSACSQSPESVTVTSVLSDNACVSALQGAYNDIFGTRSTVDTPCAVPYASNVACVACDMTATATSAAYILPSAVPHEYTLTCVTNSTLLDTVTDLALSNGTKIFHELASFASGVLAPLLPYVGTAGAIFVAVIVIIWVVRRLGWFGTTGSTERARFTDAVVAGTPERVVSGVVTGTSETDAETAPDTAYKRYNAEGDDGGDDDAPRAKRAVRLVETNVTDDTYARSSGGGGGGGGGGNNRPVAMCDQPRDTVRR